MIRHIVNLIPQRIREGYERFVEEMRNNLQGWRGQSLFFHKKIINFLRELQQMPNFNYNQLLTNQNFLEYLYATLATWGIHSMRRPFMINFEEFSQRLQGIAENLDIIRNITLENVEEIGNHQQDILNLFNGIRITTANTILVANSKLLHHLHPDLFPPVDRQYIFRYFYVPNINAKNININPREKEPIYFWEILMEYSQFYQRNRNLVDEIMNENQTGTETSVPKVIDNLVIGLVCLEKEN
jgi:hypothetical protein